MKTSLTLGTFGFLLLGMTSAVHAGPTDILIYDDVGDKPTYLITTQMVGGIEKIMTSSCDQYVDASTIKTKCKDAMDIMPTDDFVGFVKKTVATWGAAHPNQGLIPLSAKSVTAFSMSKAIQGNTHAAEDAATLTSMQGDLQAAKNLAAANPTSPKYSKRVADLQASINQLTASTQTSGAMAAQAAIAEKEIETHAGEILALFRHTEKPVSTYGSKIKNQLIETVIAQLMRTGNSPEASLAGVDYTFVNQNGLLMAQSKSQSVNISINVFGTPIAVSSHNEIFVVANMNNLIGVFRYDAAIANQTLNARAYDYKKYFSFITSKDMEYTKVISVGLQGDHLIIRIANAQGQKMEAEIDTKAMTYDMRNTTAWKALN